MRIFSLTHSFAASGPDGEAEHQLHCCVERQTSNRHDASGVLTEQRTEDSDQQFRSRIENTGLLVESRCARDVSVQAQEAAKSREVVGRNPDVSNAIEGRRCSRAACGVLVDFLADSAANHEASLLPRELSRDNTKRASYDHGPVMPQRRRRLGPRETKCSQSSLDLGTCLRHERKIKSVSCTNLTSSPHSYQATSPYD